MNQSCKVYNLTIKDIDEFRCGLTKFSADVYYYEFGYICIGFLCLIVIISIFGRIKESYKWFFLNQAFWDIFWSANYSCDNLMKNAFKPGLPCFYLIRTYVFQPSIFLRYLDVLTVQHLNGNTYSALFLLTTTRFLALYFPLFYKKLTNGSRIFLTILIFNFLVIFFDIGLLVTGIFLKGKTEELIGECIILKNLTYQMCSIEGYYKNDAWYKFYFYSYFIFNVWIVAKKPIFLLLSIIATVMLILKVTKQVKFQLKHNQKDFISSVRIVAVITLQMLVNCFTFSMEAFDLVSLIAILFKLKIRFTRSVFVPGTDLSGYLDLRLPDWWNGYYGLATQSSYQMIVQIRILFETFIVLFIMTEYRQSIVDFFKFFYEICCHPRKMFRISKTNTSTQIF